MSISPLPSTTAPPELDAALEREVRLAFAPVDKLAFGIAIGTVAGLLLFVVTAVRLLLLPKDPTELALLAQFFTGYRESWPGAFIGLAWGFVVGFVGGWFMAFSRNFLLAVWLLVVRVRSDLATSRDVLDHI